MSMWALFLVMAISKVHSQDYMDYSETQLPDERQIAETTLNKDPHFMNEGGFIRARSGNDVQLPCRIGNIGTYGTQWMRGNTVIYPSDKMPDRLSLMDDNALEIKSVRSEDATNYTCVILMDPPLKLMFYLQVFAPGGVLCFECEWSHKIPKENDICTTENFNSNTAHVSYCHHGCELSHFYEKDASGEHQLSRFTRGCAENSIIEKTCKDSEVLNWKSHICHCTDDLCNAGLSVTPGSIFITLSAISYVLWQIL